jgi:hypothetical protein
VALGLGVTAAGCGTLTDASDTTTTSERGVAAAAARDAEATRHAVEKALATSTGGDLATMKLSDAAPGSPSANAVIEWTGGKAEFDSSTGMVYSVSAEKSTAAGSGGLLTEERLGYEATNIMHSLGWTEGALQGLGFKQQQPAALESTGIYTMTWSQYDATGAQQPGSIVLTLDGGTGLLLSLSAWPGNEATDIAGLITEAQAMQIVQTQIYLRTSKPKLSLAGDGSLILVNRRVTEELKVVTDKKIVKTTPRMCWVVTLLGTVGTNTVGGTVYIDASTSEVLKYEAYKTSEPDTTTVTSGSPEPS